MDAASEDNDLELVPDFYAPVLADGETETALFSFTDKDGAARCRVYGSCGETYGFFACGSDGSNVDTSGSLSMFLPAFAAMRPALTRILMPPSPAHPPLRCAFPTRATRWTIRAISR